MIDNYMPSYDKDIKKTRDNRERLKINVNLLYWYGQLYFELFAKIPDLDNKCILEIGSGTSPLKLFYPNVITSDILKLEYLDHVIDCHMIDRYENIRDHSIDIISLTNVLHHLRDPIEFLCNATQKLKNGGQIFLLEPYFSVFSHAVYKLLHHEAVNFGVSFPRINQINGPLSTSNQAIPYMIFFTRESWKSRLANYYDTGQIQLNFFSCFSYMITGGISHKFSVPSWLYRYIFKADRYLANMAPRLFASFFIAKLKTSCN